MKMSVEGKVALAIALIAIAAIVLLILFGQRT